MNLSLLWRTHPSSPGVPYGVGGRPANSEGPGSSPLLPEKTGQPLGQMALSLSQTRNTDSPMGCSSRWRLSLGALPSQPHAIHSSQSFVCPSAGQAAQELGNPHRTRARPSHSTDGAQTERLLGNQRHWSIRGKSETDTQSSETGPPGASGGGSKSLILSPGKEKGINQTESKREKAPSSLPGQVHKFRPGCRGSYKEGKWD